MFDPEKVTYFAETDSRNRKVRFGIKAKDRSRHVYVIGKTGMGKSTLLENLAIQDILNGNGLAVIDPHGSFADTLLDFVPEHRIDDVLYFAPFDMEHPVSFNVMEDVGPDKRHLVANGLMSAFKKIWVDAWSARMEYILGNILLALLEYPDSTLVGVNRMLADKEYRDKVIANITDPSVKAFWLDEFNKYGERYMQEAGAAIQNKIGQFVSNPIIRNIIGQPKSTFDIRDIMDGNKIMIVNLSKGRVGEANANLLGGMLVTKIYLAAMSRADLRPEQMAVAPNFYLFVDEFQSFANESFADILSEARKYKLNLTIAHQYVEQMPEEVRSAVFGNVGTMITFRVGAFDAEIFEKEYAPQFAAQDLVNLGFAQIYLKLMIDGVSSQPFSAATIPPWKRPEVSFRDVIVERSRQQFAAPRSVVEEAIRKWHEEGRKEEKPKGMGKGAPISRLGAAGAAARTAIGASAARPSGPRPPERQERQERQERAPERSERPRDDRRDQRQQRPAQPAQQSRPQTTPQTAPQTTSHHQRPQTEQPRQPRRPEHREAPAPDPEPIEAVSLSALKPANDKVREQKKVMTEESSAALRNALGSVLGQLGISTEPAKPKEVAASAEPAAPRSEAVGGLEPAPVPAPPEPTPRLDPPVPRVDAPRVYAPRADVPKSASVDVPKTAPAETAEVSEVPRDVLERTLRVDDVPPTA